MTNLLTVVANAAEMWVAFAMQKLNIFFFITQKILTFLPYYKIEILTSR